MTRREAEAMLEILVGVRASEYCNVPINPIAHSYIARRIGRSPLDDSGILPQSEVLKLLEEMVEALQPEEIPF